MTEAHKKHVGIWLLICALCVVAMIMIGGATRLTESGLSMVNWQPIRGVVPPLTEPAWQEELQAYRASPEYQQKNKGMSLPQFKQIFWWEWGHRLAGRITGLVFALPLAFFIVTGSINRRLAMQCAGLFLLGGAQGLIGWFMVRSGLVDVPYVSPIRLAMHLGMAGLLLSLLLWLAYGLLIPARAISDARTGLALSRTYKAPCFIALTAIALLSIQIIYGALVAGWDAGLLYNSFPTMNGQWLPTPAWNNDLGIASLWGYADLVQWVHRWLAVMVVAVIALWWWQSAPARKFNAALHNSMSMMLNLVIAQFILGVLTIIQAVPIDLGLAHQITAFFLLAAMLLVVYIARNLSCKSAS